jgi:chromosome segregation ATPase
MVESLQRQITQLKEDVRAKEIQVDAIQKRQMEDDREKDFQLREERSRAQKEIDKFEKQVRELNLQLNTERQNS